MANGGPTGELTLVCRPEMANVQGHDVPNGRQRLRPYALNEVNDHIDSGSGRTVRSRLLPANRLIDRRSGGLGRPRGCLSEALLDALDSLA